ncbi:MAG: hypothetical protein DRI44_08220 [Chlamydiae bacterium]|nr:MAG: hypothetical protein DRI44_08220 [Chlamydiota bacterium]
MEGVYKQVLQLQEHKELQQLHNRDQHYRVQEILIRNSIQNYSKILPVQWTGAELLLLLLQVFLEFS